MAEKKHYSQIIMTNPAPGREEDYINWYAGRHVNELMHIPGFCGCRLYKLTDSQLSNVSLDESATNVPTAEEKQYKYYMLYDFYTDDIEFVNHEIMARINDGRVGNTGEFAPGWADFTGRAISDYIVGSEIIDLSWEDTVKKSNVWSYDPLA